MIREVPVNKAIGHALWEAHACIGQWAFCACLAMLRKALDLWSRDYQQRHVMIFDKSLGEQDNLYWRLKKIANENSLFKESIYSIINELRLDANDAIHEPTICSGGQTGTYDGTTIMAIRGPYEQLHRIVVNLITTTLPDINVVYSDTQRWRREPPS